MVYRAREVRSGRRVILKAYDSHTLSNSTRKQALERRRKALMAFIERIPGPAWITAPDGSVPVCNQRFRALRSQGSTRPRSTARLQPPR